MKNTKFSQNAELKNELAKAFKSAFKSQGVDPSSTSWASADCEEMFRSRQKKAA